MAVQTVTNYNRMESRTHILVGKGVPHMGTIPIQTACGIDRDMKTEDTWTGYSAHHEAITCQRCQRTDAYRNGN